MLQRDSVGYTIGAAVLLCVVCSMCVSVAAVVLKDQQSVNMTLDRQKNILDATGLAYAETGEAAALLSRAQVAELFKRIDERLVNLETGQYDHSVAAEAYDERKAAKDPKTSVPVLEPQFNPGVKQREKIARVYFVRNDQGQIQQVVLPVYGKGLWSTMYGFLALKSDLKTVQGLSFYSHGETPGLGGEVDNPNWKRQWEGRSIYDLDSGKIAIGVAKGPAQDQDRQYKVDGLSGATITARGVENLLRYWISDDGFSPFLKMLEAEIAASGEKVNQTEASVPDSKSEGT